MPVMDGFEATSKIREYEKTRGLPRTPIIGMVVHCMQDWRKCLDAGMDDSIVKPLRRKCLVEKIGQVGEVGKVWREQHVQRLRGREIARSRL